MTSYGLLRLLHRETDQLGLVQAAVVAWSCSSSGLVLFKPLLLLVLGAFAITGLVQAQDQQANFRHSSLTPIVGNLVNPCRPILTIRQVKIYSNHN
ncbi:hypothetical protein YC2023_072784 [Brassica napus]